MCAVKVADSYAIFDFNSKLHTVIEKEGITGEQLHNCDETGLYFKISRAEKSAPGFE